MVDVHRATVEELDAVVPLFEQYLRFFGREHSMENVQRFLAARLRTGDSLLYLAQDGGEAVGVAHVYPTFSSLSLAPAWVLNDLFVDPAARGSGIGRALLGAVRADARRADAVYVALETAHGNVLAQKLYESEGFVIENGNRHYSLPL